MVTAMGCGAMTETVVLPDLLDGIDWAPLCESQHGCSERATWARVKTCCGRTIDLCDEHKARIDRWVRNRGGYPGTCDLCGVESVIGPDLFIWIRLGGGE